MIERRHVSEVMPAVVAALQRLVREQNLTNDELIAALGFLTEVGRADEFVLLSDVLGVSRIVDDQTHTSDEGTASNVLGPFYRPEAPWIDNPGSIAAPSDPGTPLILQGTVTDARSAAPIRDAVLDVWQANADGEYSGEAPGAEEWSLRGRQRADAEGRYQIATVQPKFYTVKHDGPVGGLLAGLGRHPWRPAHIHVMASADGFRPLVTQIYLAGGPYLDDDTISGVKSELIAPIVDDRIEFDISLTPA